MLKGIKNRVQGISLIYYILTKKGTVEIEKKYTKDYILKYWEKRDEKNKEIFRDPRILEKRMAGDCDDLATLLVATDKEKSFILAYPIKNDSIFHIFFIDKDLNILDRWKSPKKFKMDLKELNILYKSDYMKLIKVNISDKNINISELTIG